MEEQRRPFNYEHEFQTILEKVKIAAEAEFSATTISIFDTLAANEILRKFGVTIFNSIQLMQRKLNESLPNSIESSMDFGFGTKDVILNSSSVEQLQQQVEYANLMNDVWIGIVFTFIIISMVFCVCSCFLYHQFRDWKRNYNTNSHSSSQCTIDDIEALKLQSDLEDPLPEYTLVSGLPSYEDALKSLQKTPSLSGLIVFPSVFNVFNKHERANSYTKNSS